MGKKKLINQELVQKFLESSAGKQAVDVVKIYYKKNRGLSDEEIADKLKTKVTEIRAVLNRLHYKGIAQYTKTRNKKTGWYSYTWVINEKKILQLLMERQKEEIKRLAEEEKKIQDYSLFVCKNKCDELVFEIAAQYQFQCPECGEAMETVNNQRKGSVVRKEIKKIEQTIDEFKKMYTK